MRFMQGLYVGTDGRLRQGSFGFICPQLLALGRVPPHRHRSLKRAGIDEAIEFGVDPSPALVRARA